MNNIALTFIKPHVVKNDNLKNWIKNFFNSKNISIIDTSFINSNKIKKNGIIDKHYAIHSKPALIDNISKIDITQKGKNQFYKYFGKDWDKILNSNKILSGLSWMKKFKKDSADLLNLWQKWGFKKVGGIFISHFKDSDHFVVNGFYPFMRDSFNEGDGIEYMLIKFDPKELNWSDFRKKIIGKTDPKANDKTSLRGYFYKNKDKFNIDVTYQKNIIHASASPFESLIEQYIWIENFEKENDPFFQILKNNNLTIDTILSWRNNNLSINIDGEKIKIVDYLEDSDIFDIEKKLKVILENL